jgi:tetratricopeptide (TPR) repeat protein
MPDAIQTAYLERARFHFETSLANFPQDIYAMLGLASCLDALERPEEAGEVLERARICAPLYGNILHAQGNHYLQTGDLTQAERCFTEARDAGAFRDWRSASRALEQVIAARSRQLPPLPESVADR